MADSDPPRRRSTRDRPAKTPLSERAVIEAGMEILRAEGLDAVTMRRVATRLDTGAASLYVYVGGRDELLRLLFDEVAGMVPIEEPDPARWREQLRALALGALEACEAHPGIARVALAEVPLGPNGLAVSESMLSLLLAGGVAPQRAAWALDALSLLITANAVETAIDQERVAAGEGPMHDKDALRATFAELSPERFPGISAHAAEMVQGTKRDRFIFMIDTFVDGLLR